MGKTPKKAAPGGDERNMYKQRLKSTNATSKISETILPERQREPEGLNRPKLTGIQKKIPTAVGKQFKSKLRSPTKFGLNHPTKRLGKVVGTSNTDKKSSEIVKETVATVSAMQPKSEEAEVKVNMPLQKENSKEEVEDKKIVESENEEKPPVTEKQDVEHTVHEETSVAGKQADSENSEVCENGEKVVSQSDEPVESTVKENDTHESNNNDPQEELPDPEMKLTLDVDDEPTKTNNVEQSDDTEDKTDTNIEVDKEIKNDEEKKSDESEVTSNDTKSISNEKEDQQSDTHTDTESSSAETVEKVATTTTNDSSFVSYDASIMLKDVQIKLNDCLKDNSKLFDVSSTEKSTFTHPSKELSFGRTLRNISGRHSINRMRHVTVRENRLSPNSSLFVNTSAMSMTQDEPTDFKVLPYSSVGHSESHSTNGSPLERKRKVGLDDWSSVKKPKIESENSLLNTSIGNVKSFRRPMHVSTPNKAGYKFQAEKLNISGISSSSDGDDVKSLEQTESTKKWCVIM